MGTGDKNKKVVGVGLDRETGVPRVLVKGAGAAADWAVDTARQADTPVVRDPQLVNQLYQLPVDAPVGRELFPVMAVLLGHVLRADKEAKEQSR